MTSPNGEHPPYVPSSGQLPQQQPHGARHVELPTPAAAPLPVIQADHADLVGVTAVIAAAFVNLPQSKWVVPDDQARAVTLPAWTGMQVDDALNHGVVHAWATAGRQVLGAALWTWAQGHGTRPGPQEYDQRLRLATGDHVDRYRQFETIVEDNAPPAGTAQVHLWMIGVQPDHHGLGIGSTLLRVMHHTLDASGYTVYLEAADQRSRTLYLRHGYVDAAPPYHLPDDGPAFYPMVRRPNTGAGR
jgi:GNAT superfamily N-acetyltransferase